MKPNGAAIRALRQHQGLTLAELGGKAGINESRLSKIERFNEGTMPAKLINIAKALGVPLAAVISASAQAESNSEPERVA